jgi:8-amino-7-oxononanoate synthase
LALLDRYAREELAQIAAKGLLRALEPLTTPAGAEVTLQGPRGPERLVNWSSNDYLGLAGDPRLAEALSAGARAWGTGAGASRLVTGDFAPVNALEAELAAFEGSEAALLFGSGYAANLGMFPALAGPEDVVCSDALNHASLVDGCKLSRARVAVYPHCDLDALETALRAAGSARRRLVVTDTVFSMDGDVAPLAEIAGLCERHAAVLIVDEAHATGVLGPRGAGLVRELGLEARVDARMGTLSKALGVVGAHVAGSRALRELLVNKARPLIYSTALPPALAEAARASLAIVGGLEGDEKRARLFQGVRQLAAGLRKLGIAAEERSAIFPVVLGAPERAVAVAAGLRQRGHLVKAIRPPTVPAGTSRLRIALSAAHGPERIGALLEALGAVL